jgi:elongation factor P hydroxylase
MNTDAFPDADAFHRARRALLKAVIEMTMPARSENTLLAKNVCYHTDELLRALDAWYADEDPEEAVSR